MARYDDFLAVIQNGVVAVNGLITQLSTSFSRLRPRLTSATTYYIATGGNDANTGLASTSPFRTFAGAMSVLIGKIDWGGQTVTLQALSSAAAFTGAGLKLSPWTGGGTLIFDGGSGSIATSNDDAIAAATGALPGTVFIRNVTLSTSGSGSCLACFRTANFTISSGVTFGACVQSHIDAEAYGTVRCLADYTVTGGAQNHWNAVAYGQIAIFGHKVTFSSSATAFNFFANCTNGQITVPGDSFGNSSTVTGTRYQAIQNGIIDTQGMSSTYLPGNSSGIINSGGQYT